MATREGPREAVPRRPAHPAPAPLITLLTDFGLADIYVGVMKGVIRSIAPEAATIDISHAVPPGDIQMGGFSWAGAVPFFPRGTVHVAVVDPGVGGPRRIVAARGRGSTFIAPDNGLLGFVLDPAEIDEAVEVRDRRWFLPDVSRTFHGRDIFAPVAARLVRGLRLARLGPPAGALATAPLPTLDETATSRGIRVAGTIVAIDNFGNCITNIMDREGAGLRMIRAGKHRIPETSESYEARRPGEKLAIIGSTGFLEIAVNRGRADRVLGLRRGLRVTAWRR